MRAEILADGDPLRAERLARSLRAELATLDGLDVAFAPAVGPPAYGAKIGLPQGDTALVISLGVATQAGLVRLAVEVVRAWCARERSRSVRITVDGRTIEIDGSPSTSQERVIAEFLGSGDK